LSVLRAGDDLEEEEPPPRDAGAADREGVVVRAARVCGGAGRPATIEEPERVVVEVRALLQMEFGYDQRGVLRIPCAADEFRRASAADSTASAIYQRSRADQLTSVSLVTATP
jgi:hypothetical protein